MKNIGIHFGDHNVVMACLQEGEPRVIPNRQGQPTTPAVVAVGAQGELLVGQAAQERALADPASALSAVRRRLAGAEPISLGGRTLSSAEAAGLLLCHLQEDAEKFLGEPVGGAVLTLPAGHTAQSAEALRQAAVLAGLEVLQVVPEPAAACLAYGSRWQPAGHQSALVYHLTSTGLEVSVVLCGEGTIRLLAHASSDALSGDRMTDAMLDLLSQVIQGGAPGGAPVEQDPALVARLRAVAEEARIAFGQAPGGGTSPLATGPETGFLGQVTAAQYEERIRPLVEESMAVVRDAIHQAGLTPRDMDRVIPVGAATRTPLVRSALSGLVGKEKPLADHDPAHCLALGAAVQAGFLGQEESRPAWQQRLVAVLDRRVGRQPEEPASQVQAPLQHPAPPAPCYSEGCQRAAAGHCLICGRAFCQEHGSGERCASCLDALTAAMVACYERAGSLDDAQAALATQATLPARYHLGRIRALQGELEPALADLQAVLESRPADALARTAAARALCARAAQRTAAGDHLAANEDLRRALELDPNLPGVRRYLAILENLNAFAHVQRGELARAAAAWEAEQRRTPESHRLAHNLAILYYRLACEREEAGDPAADDAWRKAIANWALVVHTPAFWREWQAERAPYVGAIAESMAEELQRSLLSRLRSDLHEQYNRHAQAGRTADAARHREYQVLLALECRAAGALRALLEAAGDGRAQPAIPFVCGPLMLRCLGQSPAGRQVVAAIEAFSAQARPGVEPKGGQPVHTYLFSPLGRIHVLLEDNWLDQAIAELDEMLKAEPESAEVRGHMVAALKGKAEDLIEATQYDEALAALERALGHGHDLPAVQALVAQACTRRAHQLSQEKQVEQAIAVLERGLRLAPQEADIKTNLCACYCERGRQLNNDNQYDAAIKLLERALQVDGQNAQARNFMQVSLLNKAAELAKGGGYGRYDRALELAQRAVALGDLAPDHRKFVAHLYNERGVQKWNMGRRLEARSDFEQAFKFNPTDNAIRQNLINSGGIANMDVAALMEILRQNRR